MTDENEDQDQDDTGEDQADDNQQNENESQEDNTGEDNEAGDGTGAEADAAGEDENLTDEQKAKQKEDEDFILGFKDEDWDDPEKAKRANDLTLKNFKTTIHQKNHFRQKFEDMKSGKNKNENGDGKKPKPNSNKKQNQNSGGSAERTEFRLDNPGLGKNIVDEIEIYAKSRKISMEEARKSPMIQSFIKQTQQKNNNADASVGSNQRKKTTVPARDWTGASEAEVLKERNRIMGAGH